MRHKAVELEEKNRKEKKRKDYAGVNLMRSQGAAQGVELEPYACMHRKRNRAREACNIERIICNKRAIQDQVQEACSIQDAAQSVS